ncbi:MFS transporter [Chloroflexia bacterium SDU3-3]|nr:MFS transporter [Chloroflexia bacterium SDU3-3]
MENEPFDKRSMAILAGSHVINDINQGAVPALLPFLIAQRGLSYTAATSVVLAATVISAVVQPLLGYYSDKRSMPWLLPMGLLLGAVGLALAGLVPSYWMIIVCVLLNGFGVAAYHPEGYRFANYLARSRPALGMSIFTVGGNVGFALGPLLMGLAISAWGLPGTMAVMPTALLATGVLLWAMPRFARLRPAPRASRQVAEAKSDWSAFARVTLVIILRASLYYGMLSFVPSYLIHVRGVPLESAPFALTVLSISGAVGTLLGGFLADRFGYKRVLMVLLALITPMLLLFLNAPTQLALLCVGLVGFATLATFTIAVVIGQEYASANLGVASGITTGLAIGVGGASTPLFGLVADHFGLTAVFYVLGAMPILAFVIAATLPGSKRQSQPAPLPQPVPKGA